MTYSLTKDQFILMRDLILKRTGLIFTDKKMDILSYTVANEIKRTQSLSFEHYYNQLYSTPTESELWDHLVEEVTVGETYFFRDPDQLSVLEKYIIPDLVKRHQIDKSIRVWSAGCASGEEAYTLAILLRKNIPDIDQWNVKILGTDINKHLLQKAILGHYRQWSFRLIDSVIQETYFKKVDDHWELDPKIRSMARFSYLNLVDNVYPSASNQTAAIDLILCRNVTIYIPLDVIPSIAEKFYKCLLTGGWLLVGPSEANSDIYFQFKIHSKDRVLVYQKLGKGETPEASKNVKVIVEKPHQRGQIAKRKDYLKTEEHKYPKTDEAANSLDEMCAMVQKLIRQHRYDEAKERIYKCLDADNNYLPAIHYLAHLEANIGNMEQAQTWATRALEIDPLQSEIYYLLGLIQQEIGNFDQAIIYLKRALYLNPGFILAHFDISALYMKQQHRAEASKHRRQAVRLASKLQPDHILPGSDDFTVGHLLTMAKVDDKIEGING